MQMYKTHAIPTIASIIVLRKLVARDHVGACARGDRACVSRVGPARSASAVPTSDGGGGYASRHLASRERERSRQAGRQDLGKATAGRSFY